MFYSQKIEQKIPRSAPFIQICTILFLDPSFSPSFVEISSVLLWKSWSQTSKQTCGKNTTCFLEVNSSSGQIQVPKSLEIPNFLKRRYIHPPVTFKLVHHLRMGCMLTLLMFSFLAVCFCFKKSLSNSQERRMLNTVLQSSSRNVLWNTKHIQTFHQHRAEEMITEFRFFGGRNAPLS